MFLKKERRSNGRENKVFKSEVVVLTKGGFMKKFVTLSMAVLVFVCFMTPMLYGQTAKIKVEALSPFDIDTLGWTSPTSSGLKVVGKGETVYMSGWEAGFSVARTDDVDQLGIQDGGWTQGLEQGFETMRVTISNQSGQTHRPEQLRVATREYQGHGKSHAIVSEYRHPFPCPFRSGRSQRVELREAGMIATNEIQSDGRDQA